MTFAEYLEEVRKTLRANPEWRPGQAYFNVLTTSRSILAEEIRGSVYDPFYDDWNIAEFLTVVLTRW